MKVLLKECKIMRLYNLYYFCKKSIGMCKSLDFTYNKTASEYVIEHWPDYRNLLSSLFDVEIFKKSARSIYSQIPASGYDSTRPAINGSRKEAIQKENAKIIHIMESVIQVYESMGLPENKIGVDVKIPECDSLKEYVSYLKELDFIFSNCPYLINEDEQLKFSNVDVGSTWITFVIEATAVTGAVAVTGSIILKNIASLLDAVMTLKSHYISLKEHEENLRIRQRKNNLADDNIEVFNQLKRIYMDDALLDLEDKICEIRDPEEKTKLEKSIEKLEVLMEKGVEIYASIDAPKDLSLLFPPMSDTEKLPGDLLKFLEDKSTNT